MKALLKLKNFAVLLAVTLFLSLHAPTTAFAQDWKKTITKAGDAFKAKQYDETINLATQAWALAQTPSQKYLTAAYRSLGIKNGYLYKGGGVLPSNEFTAKYDAATIEKIRLGISDEQFAINYLNNDPSAAKLEKTSKGNAYFKLGLYHLHLADRATHNPNDYAIAEKNLREAARLGVSDGDPQAIIPDTLAGQGKFDEARREYLSRFMSGGKDSSFDAQRAVRKFDFAGELLLSDAFLLEVAGKLKAAGKPLGDLEYAFSKHRTNLENIGKFSNPTTAFELMRQGGLLYLAKQPDKAAQSLISVAETSGNPTALRWLTLLNLQQKSYPLAENLAAKILAANPNDVIGLTARGFVAATKNNLAQAEKDLNAAITTYPEAALFANTFQVLAQLYQKQNKTAEMNEVLARQKKLADLYTEAKSAKPKSFADEMLDKRPND